MRVCWLVDTFLTDDRRDQTGFPSLLEAAAEAGHPVYQTKYVSGSMAPDPNIPFGPGDCVVTYGTHQFVNQIKKARGRQWVPGSYSVVEKLGYVATAGHLGDLMLNDDFILLPFGEVIRRGCDTLGDAFFLKPEAVTKAFTGFVMTRGNWHTEITTLREKHAVTDDVLCVVAKPREIEAEFRFVIADRQVVTGSQYRWADRLDVRLDVLAICEEMAWTVARHKWQPDRVYVCDVALLDGRSSAKVVELNSFSSAGTYSCDTRKIIDAVSRAAWSEYLGYD